MPQEAASPLQARDLRLASLVAERGLRTNRFRADLKALTREFNTWDTFKTEAKKRGERPTKEDYEEELVDQFEDWFGTVNVVPAAHRIIRTGNTIWDVTVEVYEVENSVEIPDWKIAHYGRFADGEGPHFDLHIIDKYDHELIVKSNDLMSYWLLEEHTKKDAALLRKQLRSRAVAQHHTPIVVDNARTKQLEQETDRLRRELKKIELTQVGNVLQDIIWGLGSQMPHKEIAARCGVNATTVRATSLLLASKNVTPHELVKETQARWKVAYDALRELGIST